MSALGGMNMRTNFKVVMILMLALTFALIGCKKEDKKFNAGEYVKATLDCLYKGEYDTYIKLTDSTEEEAQAEYEGMLDENAAALEVYELSDELLAEYRAYFADVHAKTEYSVKEVAEDAEGNFIVTMEVSPINYMEGVEEIAESKFAAYAEEIQNSGEAFPSTEEQTDKFYRFMLEASLEVLANATYEEAVTVDVYVYKDADGVYCIDEEDFVELTGKLFVF